MRGEIAKATCDEGRELLVLMLSSSRPASDVSARRQSMATICWNAMAWHCLLTYIIIIKIAGMHNFGASSAPLEAYDDCCHMRIIKY